MKRIISVLCAIAIMASLASFSVSSAEPVISFSLEAATLAAGDTSLEVSIIATLPEGATGYELGSFGLNVTYDSSVMQIAESPVWQAKGTTRTTSETLDSNPYLFLWASIKTNEQFQAGENVIATMKFNLSKPAVLGEEYTVGLTADEVNEVCSMESQDRTKPEIIYTADQLSFTGATVVAEDLMYGDLTGDKSINLSDVTKLLQYIAKWNGVTVNTTAADVTADGDVNISDVSRLLQYIAKWEGVILGPKK